MPSRLADLTRDLSFEFPGVPATLIESWLRRAARIMCEKGDLVVHRLRLQVLPGIEAYALEADDDSEPVAVLRARAVDPTWGEHDLKRLQGPPQGWVSQPCCWLEPGEIRFRGPAGLEWGALVFVDLSVAPRPDACCLDDALAVKRYQTLLSGARWLARDTLGKPWADKAVAMELRREFMSGIAAAKAELLAGRMRGPLRLKNRRFL